MIIVISGSVGVGKTMLADALGKKYGYEVLHLNEWAENYKIEEQKELQTFDFDVDALLDSVEEYIRNNKEKNILIESHFAHMINPELVDYLFVINRTLEELKKEYQVRGYNDQKIKDNLEVESFNLCFFEAEEEGYQPSQVKCIDNSTTIEDIITEIESYMQND